MRLHDLIEAFVDDVTVGKINETPAAYRVKMHRLLDWLGDRPVTEITSEKLNQFKNDLLTRKTKISGHKIVKGQLSVWTVRSVLRTVKHFCRWLYENGYLSANPADKLKVPKAPPMDPKFVTSQTVEKLIAASHRMGQPWEQSRNLALLYLLRDTGGRMGALLNIEIDRVDLKAGEIETRSKGKIGTLYISHPTASAISAWLEMRESLRPTTTRLLVSQFGRYLRREGARSILRRLAKEARITNARYNPHAFRHAFARDLLKSRQADLSQVSRLMWHSGVNVTADYYARWDNAELKAIHQNASPGSSLPMINNPQETMS